MRKLKNLLTSINTSKAKNKFKKEWKTSLSLGKRNSNTNTNTNTNSQYTDTMSCSDFNKSNKESSKELRQKYEKQKFGREKYYNKYIQCLDEDISSNKEELSEINETSLNNINNKKTSLNNINNNTTRTQKIYNNKLKKYKKKTEANKYRKNIRTARKKLNKICTQKARSFCKLTKRRKDTLLKKREILKEKGHTLKREDKDDLEKYTELEEGIKLCIKYRRCDSVSLGDIPYNSKYFIKGIKETFVYPLFDSFGEVKKMVGTPKNKNK